MSEHKTVTTTWKRYPDVKPPKEHGLPHWENRSESVLVIIDDGSPYTSLGEARLHGLWDDGCGAFVAEEWRTEDGAVVNVTHWKENMPRQSPASNAVNNTVAGTPLARGKNYDTIIGKPSHAEKLTWPMMIVGIVLESWRMAKEIWKRFIKP